MQLARDVNLLRRVYEARLGEHHSFVALEGQEKMG